MGSIQAMTPSPTQVTADGADEVLWWAQVKGPEIRQGCRVPFADPRYEAPKLRLSSAGPRFESVRQHRNSSDTGVSRG